MDANKTNLGGINPTLRRGFTLVELLTVIIIIGILAGLITAAAVPAMRTARVATIRQEITQLEMALEKYKQERGDYPPDFAGVTGGATGDAVLATNVQNAVLQHFRKAFPRYRPGTCTGCPSTDKGTYLGLLYDIRYATRSDPTKADTGMNAGNIHSYLNPATALVLMLGGPPAPQNSSTKLLGFSANPANPFAIGGSRLPSLYEFDETRLQISYDPDTGVPTSLAVFIPPHMPQSSSSNKAPYVYFRPRNRDYGLTRSSGNFYELPFFCQSLEQGICTPYAEIPSFDVNSKINRWMEPTKFQIICAGLDGLFREPITDHSEVEFDDLKFNSSEYENIRFLSGEAANIAPEEDDNITNFTQGKLADRAEQ